MMRRSLIAMLAALAGALAGAEPGAAATNGRIAFQGFVGRTPQVFTVAPDGTDVRQVTRVGPREPGAENPTWSPDGTTIAFDGASRRGVDLYTVAPDGGGLRQLPIAVGDFNGDPAYSPDGRFISFDQDSGPGAPTVHGIFVANADGSGARRLTTGIRTTRAFDTESQWSPDGRRIAFTRVRRPGQAAIFVIGIDGSGLRRLTPWRLDAASPDWSPDGRRIVFSSHFDPRPDQSSNLFWMRPDGSRRTALTHHRGGARALSPFSFRPSWAPDGTRIVFTRAVALSRRRGRIDLWTMAPDGSGARRLTHLPRLIATKADWGTAR